MAAGLALFVFPRAREAAAALLWRPASVLPFVSGQRPPCIAAGPCASPVRACPVWQALAFMYQAVAPRRRPPDARSVVVHFRDCRETRQAPGIGVRGMVFSAPNWMSRRIAVTCEERGSGCGGCWDTLALLFFQAGRIESAIKAQERAVSLLAERAAPDVLARLRHYRAAQTAGRGAGLGM